MDIEIEVDPEILRNIFLKHEVISDYKLEWKSPDKPGVVEFLCGHTIFQNQGY